YQVYVFAAAAERCFVATTNQVRDCLHNDRLSSRLSTLRHSFMISQRRNAWLPARMARRGAVSHDGGRAKKGRQAMGALTGMRRDQLRREFEQVERILEATPAIDKSFCISTEEFRQRQEAVARALAARGFAA